MATKAKKATVVKKAATVKKAAKAAKPMKRAGGGTTPTRRPDGTVGPTTGPTTPTLPTGPLRVTAQGATLKDDDRLMFAVHVTDADGVPITGLKKANFKLWQLGHLFSELDDFFVVELGEISGLEGAYHLVRKPWSLVGNGTTPFFVRVQKGALRSGTALTFIVKVREGLDL